MKNLLKIFIIIILYILETTDLRAQSESRQTFLIKVENVQARSSNPINIIKNHLKTGPKDLFVLIPQENTSKLKGSSSNSLEKYQQFYSNIKVEHGIVNLNYKQGALATISGEFYNVDNLPLSPEISEKEALTKALHFVNAKLYKWQVQEEEDLLKTTTSNAAATYFPKGELVIVEDVLGRSKNKNVLAYKFDIYAVEPLRRDYIYVNANTGEVVLVNPILKLEGTPATGKGETRYSGEQTLHTSLNNRKYYLKDYSRGLGIETYDLKKTTNISGAVDFIDDDNIWSKQEYNNFNKDDAALDAHFGAVKTYDYFLQKHNRNSIDGAGGKIKSYVHFGYSVFNAYWDGSVLLFGDGDAEADPLTTLDITAHEIGHAICQHSADLVYAYEPGALNEGLSDIWGACVEYFVDPTKATWLVGEDMKKPMRSMEDPNQFQHPDTYKGDYWYSGSGDFGGVHFNSGVINHWFYLLSQGKTGVNDHNLSYSVQGIGIDKASQIVFRTETHYLTPNSQYLDCRDFSIQAAIDLFGENSNEAKQTANAWKAVGVYHKIAIPKLLAAKEENSNSIRITWSDNSNDEDGFKIERATVSSTDFTEIAYVPTNTTTFLDTGLAPDQMYFYRIKAVSSESTSDYSNIIQTTLGNTEKIIVMKDTMVKTCGALLLDPGTIGNYPNNKNYILTIVPEVEGSKVSISFTEFHLEDFSDYLYILDGPNIKAPLIANYTGSQLPKRVVASNPTGQLTLQFITNRENNYPGFRANISCIDPSSKPEAPSHLTGSAFLTKVHLNWVDNSYTEKGFNVYRSFHPNAGFVKIGEVDGNLVNFIDVNTSPNFTYYYKVAAFNDKHVSSFSEIIAVTTGQEPIIMKNSYFVTCNAPFLDPGGFNNYPNNSKTITTIYPDTPDKRIQLSFSEFNINIGYDVLMIYDGPNTDAPVIFDGTKTFWIDSISASNPTGALTVKFTSGNGISYAGWVAYIKCLNYPPPAPSALRILEDSLTSRKLVWNDNSETEDGFIIEISYNGEYFFQQAKVGKNISEYTDSFVYTPGMRMFYRVFSYSNDGGRSMASNVASSSHPLSAFSGSFYSCNYTLLDPGGLDNYAANSNIQMTLNPSVARARVSLSFSSFDTEENKDILKIYDGENAAAPLIGSYSGNTLPPKVTATNANGTLTLVFTSNDSINKSGWEATVDCNIGSSFTENSVKAAPINRNMNETNSIEKQITLYPNPASSFFQIELPSNVEWVDLAIIDLHGHKKTIVEGKLKNKLKIDATPLNKGLNIIELKSKSGSVYKKLMID